MKWTYDSDADAAYLRLTKSKIVESEEARPGIVFDFDKDGKIVGIEISPASKRLHTKDLVPAAAE